MANGGRAYKKRRSRNPQGKLHGVFWLSRVDCRIETLAAAALLELTIIFKKVGSEHPIYVYEALTSAYLLLFSTV